jgi:hypothetical protein
VELCKASAGADPESICRSRTAVAIYVSGISTRKVHPEFPPRLGTLTFVLLLGYDQASWSTHMEGCPRIATLRGSDDGGLSRSGEGRHAWNRWSRWHRTADILALQANDGGDVEVRAAILGRRSVSART